ncbi:HEPN domain-containing protein [Leeuwenhoekiella nanhaiensis]|uniref:Uncharacterized protein n=1 Tax=Leeuwenhoekiella nanhaiensis TaxID=1655491 RepID=A0A2G1VMA1_9FLAO|nr:HEPN domain-containing protein [Leeuwenhoekiella nanhaiensis]PHQ27891.1 hypothetical protein CJ305_17645 [Leeuwenhoekiella nanhaiensis]
MEIWHVLVNGLRLKSASEDLLENIWINNIFDKFSIFDLASLGATGFRNWTMLEGRTVDCIEIVVTDENLPDCGYDLLNRAWLVSALFILKNYSRCTPLAYLDHSWVKISGINKTGPLENNFIGGLLDEHKVNNWAPQSSKTLVEDEDLAWIRDNYEKVNRLANESDIFREAITTICDWRAQPNYRAAIALLWSSIESIVKVDREITFQSSLYISTILNPKGDSRYEAFKKLKKLYGLRSRIVHGSPIKEKDVIKAMAESYDLLRELIFYMIELNEEITKDHLEKALFYN